MTESNLVIPFMGYKVLDRVFADSVEYDLGIYVDRSMSKAGEGLEAAQHREYPLIIVSNNIELGTLEADPVMYDSLGPTHSLIQISLIERLRQTGLNGQTPILALTIERRKAGSSRPYLRAGATGVYYKADQELEVLVEMIREGLHGQLETKGHNSHH